MDKADYIAPGKAVLNHRHRPLANGSPHAALHRFQANAMLIGGPQFHTRTGKGGGVRS